MRTLADLILDLQHATDRDRGLDKDICLAIGYKQSVLMQLSVSGKQERRVVWTDHAGAVTTRFPHFTNDLDAATDLANIILPGCTAAVSWEYRGSSATIEDGPRFYGATPSLALCIAALSAKHQMKLAVVGKQLNIETEDG